MSQYSDDYAQFPAWGGFAPNWLWGLCSLMSREFSCSFPADKTECVVDNLPPSNSKVMNV